MPITPPTENSLLLWSEIARNGGILVAGVIGLAIAWWRSRAANIQAQAALEQSELARRDHITEIFNRAVGQLGDEKLVVRLGAIHTLKAICVDDRYQAYTSPIIETLSVYVRERSAGCAAEEMAVDITVIVELLKAQTRPDEG